MSLLPPFIKEGSMEKKNSKKNKNENTKLAICEWTISSIRRADSVDGFLESPKAYLVKKGTLFEKVYSLSITSLLACFNSLNPLGV